MTAELNGKVMLVTGATLGIGKAAALELAKRGASLVLVGRNRERTERVVAEIKSASGNDDVTLLVGDLSSLAEVRRVAAEFKATHDRLDVLVNNAGAVFTERKLSADGFEMTFALNHLGYFLLTHELEDLLRKTPRARVVSTSSAAHRGGRIDLADIAKSENHRVGFGTYSDSKLANILFTRELARRLASSGVVANCFHPGFVQTGFGLNNTGLFRAAVKLGASLFARTPEKGAETLVWLAASPEAGKFSGEYFHDKNIASTTARAKDDRMAKALWTFSEQLCGLQSAPATQQTSA